MFRIPDKIWTDNPEVARTLQVIQGELFKLMNEDGGMQGGTVVNQVIGRQTDQTATPVEVHSEILGDYTIHGDLFVDGTIHGLTSTSISDIDVDVNDVTGSRAIGTIYQNGESTYKEIGISLKIS